MCLLRSAFTLPRLLFLIRTAPCFQSHLLAQFDLQRHLLESLCNISLNDTSWTQASLPINSGGLGIRSAAMLASCTFLASAAGSDPLSLAILPERFKSVNPHLRETIFVKPVVESCFSSLVAKADPQGKVRLLASQQKESGAWLSAPPVTSLGLRMSNDTIRIATSLRLGTPICFPHNCSLCGSHIDTSGTHGLSCHRSQGRIPRHSHLNRLVRDALSNAQIPAILEPQGLSRTDGKRPDGLTITPWSNGHPLVWDVTCWDTFAPSHIVYSATGAGVLADVAGHRKKVTYEEISQSHIFVPLAFETSGSMGKDAVTFLHQLAS